MNMPEFSHAARCGDEQAQSASRNERPSGSVESVPWREFSVNLHDAEGNSARVKARVTLVIDPEDRFRPIVLGIPQDLLERYHTWRVDLDLISWPLYERYRIEHLALVLPDPLPTLPPGIYGSLQWQPWPRVEGEDCVNLLIWRTRVYVEGSHVYGEVMFRFGVPHFSLHGFDPRLTSLTASEPAWQGLKLLANGFIRSGPGRRRGTGNWASPAELQFDLVEVISRLRAQ